MKAILANLFLSSLFYCCSNNTPALSEPRSNWQAEFFSPTLERDASTLYPSFPDNYKYESFPSFSASDLKKVNKSTQESQDLDNVLEREERSSNNPDFWRNSDRIGYIFNPQPIFWSNPQSFKYWGLSEFTRIELPKTKIANPDRVKFNFVEKADLLSESGFLSDFSDGLIVSGDDKSKIIDDRDYENNLPDFRGGIGFNQGVSKHVTLGVGFFYDRLIKGFGKLSFKPADLPLEASFSLLNDAEDGIDVQSNISFKPSRRLVLNYHGNNIYQKFDLNWQPLSNLNFKVEGNSQDHSLNANVDLTIGKDDLSIYARANRDINDRWKWELKSTLKSLQLTHQGESEKTTSELAFNFGGDGISTSQYALFVNYKTSNVDLDGENLITSGWRYHSKEKLGQNYLWQFDLGYGTGSQGNGLIVSTSKAFLPELVLKVSYQQVSISSEEGNFKIEFSSK